MTRVIEGICTHWHGISSYGSMVVNMSTTPVLHAENDSTILV